MCIFISIQKNSCYIIYTFNYNITNVNKIYDISGNFGTNNQILTSNGNNIYWSSSSLDTNYVTNSSLTSTLTNYVSTSASNTFTSLQTFNNGITVLNSTLSARDITASGLITANSGITVSGTINCLGGNILAPTQIIGDNTNNVATTAFVNICVNCNIRTPITAVGTTATISGPTAIRTLIIYAPTTGTTVSNFTIQANFLYQEYRFVNAGSTGANMTVKTLSGVMSGNANNKVAVGSTVTITPGNSLSFTYFNQTAVGWLLTT